MTRVPALDGIRGIAILLVLAGHALLGANWLATVGVTLFFVLSGYLITGRLLAGQNLRTFYANRARRLLPAMLVMLTLTGPLFVAAGLSPWLVAEAGLYLRNITLAHFDPATSPYNHMWSLALEEQFYLLWPLVFGVVAARRTRVVAYVGAVSFASMLAASVVGEVMVARFSPITQAWALCLGCWLALRHWTPAWPTWLTVAWLRWFGDRSYGIYLWHYPFFWLGSQLLPPTIGAPLGCVIGVGLGALSWRYVEAPFTVVVRRRSHVDHAAADTHAPHHPNRARHRHAGSDAGRG